MIVYQTNTQGYFTGLTEADPDPMRAGEFIIPGRCVTTPPPATGTHELAQWVNNEWRIVPDYRGTVYWMADRSKHVIEDIGIYPPLDSFDAEPPKTLDELKEDKLRQIELDRDLAVTKNVSALGTEWQADLRSQSLLSSAVALSAAGLPLPAVWRDVYNNDVPITSVDQLLAIAGTMAAQTQEAYQASWTRKLATADALTIQDLELI